MPEKSGKTKLRSSSALGIDGSDGNVITLALNVPSAKISKKDIIKVENRYLKDDDTNKLALISPKATVNIIKDFKLVEKRLVSLPNKVERIFRCSNPDCISNSNEDIESIMDVVDKTGLILRCKYCTRILNVSELKYY